MTDYNIYSFTDNCIVSSIIKQFPVAFQCRLIENQGQLENSFQLHGHRSTWPKMKLLRIRAYFLLILVFDCAGSGCAEYVVTVDRFVFTPIDRELIPSQSATIEHVGNRSYLSGHLYLGRSVDNVIALASLEISRPNLPRVRLFNSKFDVCSFLKNTYKSKFLQQFHYRFVTFTNVQPSCPLKPVSRVFGTNFQSLFVYCITNLCFQHLNYTLERSYIDERILPELLPECSYFFNVEFREKTKPLANLHISGQLHPVLNKKRGPKNRVKIQK